MTTEAGRQLLALIDDGTDECVWMDSAVRAIEAEARAAPTIGPIQHANSMCQKDGCTCWCQACERHNWRHERACECGHPDLCTPSDPAAPLDVERLARALRTDAVRRYVAEAWVEGGVSEPGYATVNEMADAIAREYAAQSEETPR